MDFISSRLFLRYPFAKDPLIGSLVSLGRFCSPSRRVQVKRSLAISIAIGCACERLGYFFISDGSKMPSKALEMKIKGRDNSSSISSPLQQKTSLQSQWTISHQLNSPLRSPAIPIASLNSLLFRPPHLNSTSRSSKAKFPSPKPLFALSTVSRYSP